MSHLHQDEQARALVRPQQRHLWDLDNSNNPYHSTSHVPLFILRAQQEVTLQSEEIQHEDIQTQKIYGG